MSKIAQYLQEHLSGEVMESLDARKYFATDGSILFQPPAIVIYPRNENDIRKTVRFSWQLAERGRLIPIGVRGFGSDGNGAAITKGVLIVLTAHYNKILELDNKDNYIITESGISFSKILQTLHTHSKSIPNYPANIDYTTVGGALANNTIGENSYKYGGLVNNVKSIRFVLANGEVIEIKKLSKRELNKKLGISTFEGEVYRGIDSLLEAHKDLLDKTKLDVSFNSALYNLADVKTKSGFDLTPLILGSQGTLGIISEANLKTQNYTGQSTIMAAKINDLNTLQAISNEFNAQNFRPSSLEFINKALLESIHRINPNYLKDTIAMPYSEYIVFASFDEAKNNKFVKRAKKLLSKFTDNITIESELNQIEKIQRIRESSSIYLASTEGNTRATSLIEDAAVNSYKIADLIDATNQLFTKLGIAKQPMWGHLGDGIVHFYPKLDLTTIEGKQKSLRLIDSYSKLIVSLGGTLSAENSDGRIKAPFLEMQYGSEVYALMKKVKEVFDPYNFFSPGVKFGTSIDDIKQLIKSDYSITSQYTHLPRS